MTVPPTSASSQSDGRQESVEVPLYRFRHALIRDAAYEALRRRACHVHERLADWLDQRRDSLAMEKYEELIPPWRPTVSELRT
jgi:predicted ATPase